MVTYSNPEMVKKTCRMKQVTILMPVFNDWDSAAYLINSLNKTLSNDYLLNIIIINDGSSQKAPDNLINDNKINIISLIRNFGHQRAIAIGLSWISDNLTETGNIIVMDSDGEDDSAGVSSLLKQHDLQPDKIIFASRIKRKENAVFKINYIIYKMLFRLLTGSRISFGNFSLIPDNLLKNVVHSPEIWNHYSSGIIRSKLPFDFIPLKRGKRIAGKSKMSFVSLVMHGLSAISVYVDIVAVRLLLTFLILSGLSVIGILIVLYFKFLTGLAIPGWATSAATGLVLIFLLALLISLFLSFIALNHRSQHLIIPAREYKYYILSNTK